MLEQLLERALENDLVAIGFGISIGGAAIIAYMRGFNKKPEQSVEKIKNDVLMGQVIEMRADINQLLKDVGQIGIVSHDIDRVITDLKDIEKSLQTLMPTATETLDQVSDIKDSVILIKDRMQR